MHIASLWDLCTKHWNIEVENTSAERCSIVSCKLTTGQVSISMGNIFLSADI